MKSFGLGNCQLWGLYPAIQDTVDEIARVWGDGDDISEGLRVFEKSVPDLDEDAVTIAVEAARNALQRADIDPQESAPFTSARRAILMP